MQPVAIGITSGKVCNLISIDYWQSPMGKPVGDCQSIVVYFLVYLVFEFSKFLCPDTAVLLNFTSLLTIINNLGGVKRPAVTIFAKLYEKCLIYKNLLNNFNQ